MTWKGAASENFRKGRRATVEGIVIHVMDGTEAGTDAWFANPESHVSAHYGISKDGEIHQYVHESDTAFHAGTVDQPSCLLCKPHSNPNDYTIGIEHEGKADEEWTEAQYQSSAALVAAICKRWSISVDRDHIVGHHEIRASKTCPGKGDVDRIVSMAQALWTA